MRAYTFLQSVTKGDAKHNVKYVPTELEKLCAVKEITAHATLTRHPVHSAIYLNEMGRNYDKPTLNARKDAAWEDTAFHYSVKITYKDKSEYFDFKCGLGHVVRSNLGTTNFRPVAPSVGDVLYSCMMDSDACSMSFAHWCNELGYDIDSRNALEIYEACQKIGDKLFKLLPRELLAELRECEH